ncbi:MAG: hypothetical protein NTZ29_15900 [Verrucomicrobia bacterium]|nr:hypothetical protein [Verrucomicrobiota bacterium]
MILLRLRSFRVAALLLASPFSGFGQAPSPVTAVKDQPAVTLEEFSVSGTRVQSY